MRVLVTGANGFLGMRIVTALHDAGHEVVAAVRNLTTTSGPAIACDFSRDIDAEAWKPRLAGIDAVINCAGILRETRTDTFQRVHVDAPQALFRACAESGVRRVIQLSALGEPDDGEFIASKHRGDHALAQLDLDWLVLRPGLVYSAHGAYGGTILLRALAALPGFVPLPRDGSQQLRPLAAEDLADAIVAALAHPQVRTQVIELVGPEILTLREYLLVWRRWFGLRSPRVIETPRMLVALAISVGERLRRGPLCRVIANLLERRRIGREDALTQTQALLGHIPASLTQSLAQRPSDIRDFLHARWYFSRPLLLGAVGLLWVASGIIGCVLPADVTVAALPSWPPVLAQTARWVGCLADLALGAALLTGLSTRLVLSLMLAMIAIYTIGIGVSAPSHWLEPFGGLLKNIPIAALLVALLALDTDRR